MKYELFQSNRLTKIEGLGRLVNLEQLYCSHNGIEMLEGLDNNVKLQTLDMAVNRIKKIENISHLTEIEEFWVSLLSKSFIDYIILLW